MNLEIVFSTANMAASLGWILLIVWYAGGHRWSILDAAVRQYWWPLALAVVYTIAITATMTGILPSSDGGFGSIKGVRTLFESDGALLAGWVHYLAFDLFVGIGVGQSAKQRGISIWLMLPVWFFVFMFGPVGYVLWRLIRIRAGKAGDGVQL
ncbi:MAG: DUF4281 domain-containing protein [Leptospiraceae bacterium]|nr:DUF4281 domain-containing protein [Leptospiraceae bacterium]MCB1304728.1 DUF4281 domain-containing protein [Leptospiraceae bacterium]